MKLKSSTPKDLMSEIKNMDIKMVDMRFTDIRNNSTLYDTNKVLDEDIFSDGLGFDGSSVRGFRKLDSDMIVLPDPSTAYIIHFFQKKHLLYIVILNPVTSWITAEIQEILQKLKHI